MTSIHEFIAWLRRVAEKSPPHQPKLNVGVGLILDLIEDFEEQEITMAREAKVITALLAANTDLTKQVADLKSQLPAPGTTKDAADVAAEQAAADALKLDANGDPLPQAAPAQ